MIITTRTKRKLRETDQAFQVGDYNINFYMDAYLDKGKEYYLAEVIKFSGNEVIKQNFVYVTKRNKETYGAFWEKFHEEKFLDAVINFPKYKRI